MPGPVAAAQFTDDELAELNVEFEQLPGVQDRPVGGRQLRPALSLSPPR